MSLSFCILTSEVAYHNFYHTLFVRSESLCSPHAEMKGIKLQLLKAEKKYQEFVVILVKQLQELGLLKIVMSFFHLFHG